MFGRLKKFGTIAVATTALAALFGTGVVPVAGDARAGAAYDVEEELVLEIVGEEMPGSIVIDGDGTITDADLDTGLQGVCMLRDGSVTTTTTYCIGNPVPEGHQGYFFAPMIDTNKEASEALGWIVQEGVQYIRALYDVPLDARIEEYARGELRSYMLHRILDIVDKAVYEVPLTEQEQRALTFTQQQLVQRDRTLAQNALDEFNRWNGNQCGYVVPAHPDVVENPVEMPESVNEWCRQLLAHPSTRISVFATPTPSVEHFNTWAMYRNTIVPGGPVTDTPEGAELVAESARSAVALGGFALAGGGAALAAGVVGSSAALAATFTSVMGSYAATGIAAAKFSPALLSAITAGTGVAAAASIVAVVLSAVVFISIGIWKMIESVQTSATLSNAVEITKETTDPFGIAKLRETYGGLELRDGIASGSVPDYREEQSVMQLMQHVVRWTATNFGGLVFSDPDGIWEGSETTDRDRRFKVTDSSGTRTVAEIEVPTPDGGVQSVRFSDSWLVVTGDDGIPHASLTFDYVNADGASAIAWRTKEHFSISTVTNEHDIPTHDASEISFIDAGGQQVSAEIVPSTFTPLAGPHPSAIGPLLPDRVVNLRPNPVDEDGGFNLDAFTTDFDYTWTVVRFDDSSTTSTTQVHSDSEYGTRFIPDRPGRYRASVVMSDRIDSDAKDVTGVVEFEVTAPPITVDQMVLHDDGRGSLGLELELSEAVPGDEIEVTIQWPGGFVDFEEPGSPTRPEPVTVALNCHSDALHCSTGNTSENAALKEALSYELSPVADTSLPVDVVLSNTYGFTSSHSLYIEGEERLTFISPEEVAIDERAAISFNDHVVHVQQVAGLGTRYPVAGAVPGGNYDDPAQNTFGLIHPVTGNGVQGFEIPGLEHTVITAVQPSGEEAWGIHLSGTPSQDEIGSYVFPVTVQQSSGARSTLLVRLDVVPALNDRYRAGLVSDIDPGAFFTADLPLLQPMILGGKAEWEDYAGDVCVGLKSTTSSHDLVEVCEPAESLFDRFDPDQPFPYREFFPSGLPKGGTYNVWVRLTEDDEQSSSQAMSATFALLAGPPKITDLAWHDDGGRLTMRVDVDDFTAGATVASIACTLDGVEISPCFEPEDGVDGREMSWAPEGLEVGEHSLSVLVTDTYGNYSPRVLDFEVLDSDGDDGPGDGDGPGGGDGDGPGDGDGDGPGGGDGDGPGDGDGAGDDSPGDPGDPGDAGDAGDADGEGDRSEADGSDKSALAATGGEFLVGTLLAAMMLAAAGAIILIRRRKRV